MISNTKIHNNILINQFKNDGSISRLSELSPSIYDYDSSILFLTFHDNIKWNSIKGSNKIILNIDSYGNVTIDCSISDLEHSNMYFNQGNVGFGRIPLHNYKVDISVPINTKMTALHIGDGIYGFSLGNATEEGFLPQIIGIGSDKDDAGLYFLGKVNSHEISTTPAIIFDARDIFNNPIKNRPILGVTSGNYDEFKLLIDSNGNVGIGKIPEIYKLEIDGIITAKNIMLGSSDIINVYDEIKMLKEQIKELQSKIS